MVTKIIFTEISRQVLAAHTTGQQQLALGVHYPATAPPTGAGGGSNLPEFVFIGKAMAHRTDRGRELVPIARNLAQLPESLEMEVRGNTSKLGYSSYSGTPYLAYISSSVCCPCPKP